jgi:hypothetical protein
MGLMLWPWAAWDGLCLSLRCCWGGLRLRPRLSCSITGLWVYQGLGVLDGLSHSIIGHWMVQGLGVLDDYPTQPGVGWHCWPWASGPPATCALGVCLDEDCASPGCTVPGVGCTAFPGTVGWAVGLVYALAPPWSACTCTVCLHVSKPALGV